MLANLTGNETGLGVSIEGLVVANTITTRVRGPKILTLPLGVVLNDRAGYIQNRLCRSIILFEPNNLCVRVMLLEIKNVGDVSAAPFVDRLIFITYDTDVLLLLSQQTYERELQRVGVLIFIYEQVAELPIVFVTNFIRAAQQSHRLDHQVIEIKRVVRVQTFFVGFVNASNRRASFIHIIGARGKRIHIFAAILG